MLNMNNSRFKFRLLQRILQPTIRTDDKLYAGSSTKLSRAWSKSLQKYSRSRDKLSASQAHKHLVQVLNARFEQPHPNDAHHVRKEMPFPTTYHADCRPPEASSLREFPTSERENQRTSSTPWEDSVFRFQLQMAASASIEEKFVENINADIDRLDELCDHTDIRIRVHDVDMIAHRNSSPTPFEQDINELILASINKKKAKNDKLSDSFNIFVSSELLEMVVMREDKEKQEVDTKSMAIINTANKKISKRTKMKTEKKKKKVESTPIDHLRLQRYFNQDLKAYVEACVSADMLHMAQQTVNFYRYNRGATVNGVETREDKLKTYSHCIIEDVSIYDALIQAWAKEGNLDQIKHQFACMGVDGCLPSVASYARYLSCIGRKAEINRPLVQNILDAISHQKLNIQELFMWDNKDSILQAIRSVLPEFEKETFAGSPPYENTLLERLNAPISPCQVVEKNAHHGVHTASEIVSYMQEQFDLEKTGHVTVRSIVRSDVASKKAEKMREKLAKQQQEWRTSLECALERKLKYLKQKNRGEHGMTLYPFLKLFDIKMYIELLMQEVDRINTESEFFSPSLAFLCLRLGLRLQNKYAVQEKIKNGSADTVLRVYSDYAHHYTVEDPVFSNERSCWQALAASDPTMASLNEPDKQWPSHVAKAVGRILYDFLLYEMKFDSNILKTTNKRWMIPSFYTVYRSYGHVTKHELKPHPVLVKLYSGAELENLVFDVGDLPMLAPPLPWSSIRHGGSLFSTTKLVRLAFGVYNEKFSAEQSSKERLYPVLDALNTISACPWKINQPMLDQVMEVFKGSGDKSLDIPPPLSEAPILPKINKKMSAGEKMMAYRERSKIKQERGEMHSLWCNELYKLSIANKFRDKTFWFPHNLDFRGRTYPCPPHFNHLGSDVTRSILLFAKGKPLGKDGLDWLKIHLVNLTGLQKRAPNTDRLAYANLMMESILDSADNPMTGGGWWKTCDEPWQTLACCKEIATAVRSPNPEEYISYFPVHQDGSCNGLQHYAALGRDQAGAEAVNLFPFSHPQDVYSDVAQMVESHRAKDAQDGLAVAKALQGYIQRKVIKQTVMTTVYGVTRYGAKYQILKQLKDLPNFPQQSMWSASSYLTEKTFYCLQEMFTATKEIQDWLTTSAQLISSTCQRPVEWCTPLGFFVVQPYHKSFSGRYQGIPFTDMYNITQMPNTMKQKNAFPPNFIHSLDSTHMMLTALFCMQAGITYVSVHDCYWTHPADVATMNKICREQFVALHTQPILKNLSEYLLSTFKIAGDNASSRMLQSALGKVPETGTFDLNNVLKSTYFFS